MIPEKIDDIIAGADPAGIFEKIVQDLRFIFGQFGCLSPVFDHTAFQVQGGSVPGEDLSLSGGYARLKSAAILARRIAVL